MKYFLQVSIAPQKHYIHVCGRIQGFANSSFYMNENFHLISASSRGEKIAWYMEKEKPHPAFDLVSRPIHFETQNDEIEFEYDGYIPEIIAGINQIDENTVELASYSGWYPKPPSLEENLEFELDIQMPKGYEIVSNGKLTDENHISSMRRECDIVLFASNELTRYEYCESGVKCTFLCPEDMLAQMEQRAKDLVAANSYFISKYGELDMCGRPTDIVSVFRPRAGWGYKRGNASFIAAEWGKKERQYKDDFHELAHGWWNIANVMTNDWINEGGAEFSAYAASKQIYGEAYAEKYISNCVEAIDQATENISIVDTDYQSKDRYVNHYMKTAMMFIRAQKEFGEERIFGLLKRIFQTFQGTRNATTANFLAFCDDDMRTYFEKCLFAKEWGKVDFGA